MLKDQDTTPFATLETREESMPKTLCELWNWLLPAIGQTAPPWSDDTSGTGPADLSHNNTSAKSSVILCPNKHSRVLKGAGLAELAPKRDTSCKLNYQPLNSIHQLVR